MKVFWLSQLLFGLSISLAVTPIKLVVSRGPQIDVDVSIHAFMINVQHIWDLQNYADNYADMYFNDAHDIPKVNTAREAI